MASTTALAASMDRQLLPIDATEELEGSEPSDDQVFPLLGLPSGVELLLLSFLSAGRGGLRNVLQLRSVCTTTRSWVDSLTKPDADLVFSNATVHMNSDLPSLRSFHSSSPPFGVTSLRLNVEGIQDAVHEEDGEWTRFCILWNPKLESLELCTTDNIFVTNNMNLSPHLTAFMDLDNIKSITLTDNLVSHDSRLQLPPSLAKVSQLRMNGFDCGDLLRAQLFSLLHTNTNLRLFTFRAQVYEDLEAVAHLIDAKRDCPHFTLNLKLVNGRENTEAFFRLAKSIVSSRSQFGLELWGWEQSLLLTHKGRSLSPLVEFIGWWRPTQQNSSLLDFPRLKEVEHVEMSDSATAAQLLFPPSMETIGFVEGFSSCGNLPETLKELSFSSFKCDVNQLVSFLDSLSARCPELEQFYVEWKLPEERAPTLDFDGPPQGFQKLRRLHFWGGIEKGEVEDARVGVMNAFGWGRLELEWLGVGFFDSRDPQHRRLPVLGEETLRAIMGGPSGASLLEMDVTDGGVTPEAVPLLRKLQALIGENVRRRVEGEGRGAWLRPLTLPTT